MATRSEFPNHILLDKSPEPCYTSSMKHTFSAIIEKEGKLYVALCPELDVASQGKAVKKALANLKEAVSLFLEAAAPKEFNAALSSHPIITTLEVTV